MGFWWRPLAMLAALLGVSLGVMAAAGAVYGLLVFAALLLLLYLVQVWNLRHLDAWLGNPELNHLPDGIGLWERVFTALYRLQRRQSRSQDQLAHALERFRSAASAIPDGMVLLNASDQIEWCNPVAEQHFELDLAHDQNRQITYLVRSPPFVAYIGARQHSEPLVLKSPRNRETTLSVQIVPYGDAQKLLLSRDITQLERVETMRRDFIANVSHELRTPLTVVGGFVETLLDMDGEMDATERRGVLALMQEQAWRMQRLVEDLLTLSRLESPQNPLQEERVDMARLLQVLASEARSLSAGRHTVRLEVTCDKDLQGCENELHSAFGNLISNAVRYTPVGGAITLRWEERNGDGLFSVQDSGEGIAPAHIPRLTERFYRVDRSRSRETGGTGLGLSIVKHVLTRHQGYLEIESEVGHGSVFRAVLPARRLLQGGTPDAA